MRTEAPVRIKKNCPVIVMGGLVFDFALSSNSYVYSLNDVCSGINTESCQLKKTVSAAGCYFHVRGLVLSFTVQDVNKKMCIFML